MNDLEQGLKILLPICFLSCLIAISTYLWVYFRDLERLGHDYGQLFFVVGFLLVGVFSSFIGMRVKFGWFKRRK